MATKFDNESALINYLNFTFGIENVSGSEIEYRSPYFTISKGEWVPNSKMKVILKKISVEETSEVKEQSNTQIFHFKVHKVSGFCWFEDSVPTKHGYTGCFRDDLETWFKTQSPVLAPARELVVKEYIGTSYKESAAIVQYWTNVEPPVKKVFRISYNIAGNMVQRELTDRNEWPLEAR